jgi:cell division protein ZapA
LILSQANGNGNSSGNVRVDIYDQTYHLRGSDTEYIAQLAEYVDNKMRLIAQQAATVDSLRVAVKAGHLEGALDEVLQDERRAG